MIVAVTVVITGCSSDSSDTIAESAAPTTDAGSTSTPTSAATTTLEVDTEIRVTQIEAPITLADGSRIDATFVAREAGSPDDELVLLLHGFPQSSYEWRHQMTALAEAGYHAVAVDQRGYSPGARPTNDADYATPLLAADVLTFADALGAEEFHVVGHDWGAAVAWVVAGTAPDRVTSLTAVSVPHPAAYSAALENPTGEQSGKAGYIETFVDPATPATLTADGGQAFITAAMSGVGTPEDIAEYTAVLGDEEAMSAALAWYRAGTLRAGGATPATTVPTLYVWSDDDCCLGRDAAEATADYVEGPYRFETLEGVSHWVPEEAPDELNELLLAHLAG